MVFNIASAGLVWTAHQQNSTNVVIDYTEYALSLTELILIIIEWVCLLKSAEKVNIFFSLSLLTVQAFNIAYSSYTIEYFNSQNILPMRIINMSLAIIVLNCLALCGCCIGGHKTLTKEKEKSTTDTPRPPRPLFGTQESIAKNARGGWMSQV